MKRLGFCVLIFIGLFYFSEGKPCPEKVRAHKTRCELYYKCVELPAKGTHVWMPKHCAQGLVYEPNLRRCVLPGEDWECLLNDISATTAATNATIISSNNQSAENQSVEMNGMDVYIVGGNGANDDEEDGLDTGEHVVANRQPADVEVVDDLEYEASGAGDDESAATMVEVDGFLQAENMPAQTSATAPPTHSTAAMEQKEMPETNTTLATAMPVTTVAPASSTSKIDPQLTEHLQRLSQLIDGLKQTYQNTEQYNSQQQGLRADQLNAFLSHFNIKHEFDSIGVGGGDTSSVEHANTTAGSGGNLRPETKLLITRHHYPQRYDGEEYTNSHIVVNRPEGAVLFNLPPYYSSSDATQPQPQAVQPSSAGHDNTPKISEDTLRTVLELSKQMIANQNMPKIIPNAAAAGAYYAPSLLQPVYLPPQGPPINPYSFYYANSNGNSLSHSGGDGPEEYGYFSNSSTYYEDLRNRRPSRPHPTPPAQVTNKRPPAPSTTIIHNVIPVHLTANGAASSAEKELLDSYGQRLNLYPTLDLPEQHTPHQPYNQRYETNKYIASITTVRPIISSTAAPPVDAYPPYPSQLSVTTVRPFEHQPSPATIAEFYTPSPHLSDANANSLFYGASGVGSSSGGGGGNVPRPMYHHHQRRPGSIAAAAPSLTNNQQQQHYFDHAALGAPLFPSISPNRVKIRPNSQKLESVEMLDEGDYAAEGVYADTAADNDVDNNDVELAYASARPHKYMPRPSASTTSSLSASIFNRPSAASAAKPNGMHVQIIGGGAAAAAQSQQLVNVGGNFISYDVFKNSILPLLGQTSHASLAQLGQVEVITCAPGIRQANQTDCTRYYVCSKKDGKVLSYSCPPYTAFNEQTRICDARTYAQCNSAVADVNFALLGNAGGGGGGGGGYAMSHKRTTQLDAIKALQEAQRRREQALKTQALLSHLAHSTGGGGGGGGGDGDDERDDDNLLSSYVQQAQLLAATGTTTTARPSPPPPPPPAPSKKRKYYCKEGDKIADQTSMQHYFVCYKNAQGMMKGHKMACTKSLIFCARTSMCTLLSKCTALA